MGGYRQHRWPTTPNIVGCYMLRPFGHPVACCCVSRLGVVARSLKLVNNSQHFLCSVIAEAIRLHNSLFQHCWGHSRALDIVSMEIATFLLKTRLQQNFESSPNLMGRVFLIMDYMSLHCLQVVASEMHTIANTIQHLPNQQLPTMLDFNLFLQQCWELLRQFARSHICSRCRQSLQFGDFTLLFCGVRQKIAGKFVPHVQHDHFFFLTNNVIALRGAAVALAFVLA